MATTNEDAVPANFGASEFITKPVDFDQLKAQLRRLPAMAGWVTATSAAKIAARRQFWLIVYRLSAWCRFRFE
jgi:hypothetical protein